MPPVTEPTRSTVPHWSNEVATPALLRGARKTYGAALRRALDAAGYDDIPPSGAFVIGGMARNRSPLADIVAALGTSKQAAGQLVDSLVARGYLDRSVDPEDRRRLTVALTARGEAAAAVIRTASEGVDGALEDRVGAEAVAGARLVLAALIEIRSAAADSAPSA